MNKTRCPDCNGVLERVPTSAGVGYYCPKENKFIREYYEGPSWKQIERKLDNETKAIILFVSMPMFVLCGFIFKILADAYVKYPEWGLVIASLVSIPIGMIVYFFWTAKTKWIN